MIAKICHSPYGYIAIGSKHSGLEYLITSPIRWELDEPMLIMIADELKIKVEDILKAYNEFNKEEKQS